VRREEGRLCERLSWRGCMKYGLAPCAVHAYELHTATNDFVKASSALPGAK
jgi:hypothetical protein